MTISTDDSAIVPHIVKYGGPDGKQRALFILDGACSHRVEGALFTAACARNNIDVAIIPASCTNEIQLKELVNAKFISFLYYKYYITDCHVVIASTVSQSFYILQSHIRAFKISLLSTLYNWCYY